MRRFALFLLLALAACPRPADPPDAGPGDAGPMNGKPCLDRPGTLPMPPGRELPCELLPPGFGQ